MLSKENSKLIAKSIFILECGTVSGAHLSANGHL